MEYLWLKAAILIITLFAWANLAARVNEKEKKHLTPVDDFEPEIEVATKSRTATHDVEKFPSKSSRKKRPHKMLYPHAKLKRTGAKHKASKNSLETDLDIIPLREGSLKRSKKSGSGKSKKVSKNFYVLYRTNLRYSKNSTKLVCRTGSYMHSSGVCRHCSQCKKHEIVVANCTAFKNTECAAKKRRISKWCSKVIKRNHNSPLLQKYIKMIRKRFRANRCTPHAAKIMKKIYKKIETKTHPDSRRILRDGGYAGKKAKKTLNDTNTTEADSSHRHRFMKNDGKGDKKTFASTEPHPPPEENLPAASGKGGYGEGEREAVESGDRASEEQGVNGVATWVIILIVISVVFLMIISGTLLAFAKRSHLVKRRNQGNVAVNFGDGVSAATYRTSSTQISRVLSHDAVSDYDFTVKNDIYGMNSDVPSKTCSDFPGDAKRTNTTIPLLQSCLSSEETTESHTRFPATHEKGLLRGGNQYFLVGGFNDSDDFIRSQELPSRCSMNLDDYNRLRSSRDLGHLAIQCDDLEERPVNEKPKKNGSLHSADSVLSGSIEKNSIFISMVSSRPSENYIDALSEKSPDLMDTSGKIDWLSKSVEVDEKNETDSYQSTAGTQTYQNAQSPYSHTVIGTPWQFSGTFNSQGGRLQAKDSDVVLTVGMYAVAKGDYVDISGAIFTDVSEIRKKIEYPFNEILVSPVVEYHASNNYRFRNTMVVKLPHAMQENFDPANIRVYRFITDEFGVVSVHRVAEKGKTNQVNTIRDSTWEKDPKSCNIRIKTTHFSGYFCTTCEAKLNLPSLCTRVFGSHVQIKHNRREVRVLLYIWDRRLNMKDFLERIRKQEFNKERQLLADIQVPLMEGATSDGHIVMKLETLGDESDRRGWRHVPRPNRKVPLFKPFQHRKLSEIIRCCRETDPVQVEWALENVPNESPSDIFQCLIDMLHVPADTDLQAALDNADDDYMRTFYVRDLKLTDNLVEGGSDEPSLQMSKLNTLKQKLMDMLSVEKTEDLCKAFGMMERDVHNLARKCSSDKDVKTELVDYCLQKYGEKFFVQRLPDCLGEINMYHITQSLQHTHLLPIEETKTQVKFSLTSGSSQSTSTTETTQVEAHSEDETFPKRLMSQNSNPNTNRHCETSESSSRQLRHQGSDEVFETTDIKRFSDVPSASRGEATDLESNFSLHAYPLRESEESRKNGGVRCVQNARQKYKAQKSSSSGGDSALPGNSFSSQTHFGTSPMPSSMIAECSSSNTDIIGHSLNENLNETFRKELAYERAYPEIPEDEVKSTHGPVAMQNMATSGDNRVPRAVSPFKQTHAKEVFSTTV